MALLVNNPNEQRSQLQERVAAELQQRLREKAKQTDLPDGVADSAYIKNTKQTTTLAWVWVLLTIVAVGIVIWLMSLFVG